MQLQMPDRGGRVASLLARPMPFAARWYRKLFEGVPSGVVLHRLFPGVWVWREDLRQMANIMHLLQVRMLFLNAGYFRTKSEELARSNSTAVLLVPILDESRNARMYRWARCNAADCNAIAIYLSPPLG